MEIWVASEAGWTRPLITLLITELQLKINTHMLQKLNHAKCKVVTSKSKDIMISNKLIVTDYKRVFKLNQLQLPLMQATGHHIRVVFSATVAKT